MPVSTQSPDRQRPLDDDKVTGVSTLQRFEKLPEFFGRVQHPFLRA